MGYMFCYTFFILAFWIGCICIHHF